MAILKSTYHAPFWYRNAHVATILPSLFREVEVVYQRERINTSDDDFLDLDRISNGHQRLVIFTHGLEGHSQRHYVTGSAKLFSENDWDVVAWNCRSCSGELNKQPRLYSHIDAPDLACVIDYCLNNGNYLQVALVGFSMGGAITLNYMSKMQDRHPSELSAAVAISAPVDVGGSAAELEKGKNIFYRRRFIKKMIDRIKKKATQFPELISTRGVDRITTFVEYDKRYTAPLNGCSSAKDFYQRASSKDYLRKIKTPTLLVVAQNDSFMPASCYPYAEAQDHKYFHLETPKYGGHVGFTHKSLQYSWMEGRALEFINEMI